MKLSSRKELLNEAEITLKEIRNSLNEDFGTFKYPEQAYMYMNDTFMKQLKPKMESMIDDIYNNLRKMSTAKNQANYKTEQQSALDDAKVIQSIIDDGFNRKNMEMFLSTLNKKKYKPATGFGSVPQNEKKLLDVLKNVPNARAKWAKVVLDMAKQLHKRSMELVDKASK